MRDERVGSVDGAVGAAQTEPAGAEIGVARVYDFRLESGSYSTSNGDVNQWDISLFDVQTITKITLNENTTLTTPVFVEGTNSGATGFLKNSISILMSLNSMKLLESSLDLKDLNLMVLTMVELLQRLLHMASVMFSQYMVKLA